MLFGFCQAQNGNERGYSRAWIHYTSSLTSVKFITV
uniref:Uncharacterized protein n=1 Tax=Anguilla anguilla TaxID=7936 RepID=A0A0E9RSG2_ANGAN